MDKNTLEKIADAVNVVGRALEEGPTQETQNAMMFLLTQFLSDVHAISAGVTIIAQAPKPETATAARHHG